MKINRDENGNIIEVIFAEGEDQNMAWSAIQNLEFQRQTQESMKRLTQPMMPMGGMGMGIGMMPMMGAGGMNTEQLKEYQKQSEENFRQFQEQMAQQVNELTKHAAEYAFDTSQPQNVEKN